MRLRRLAGFLAALAFTLLPAGPAPQGRLGFRSYGADQGLTMPSVNAVLMDAEGFLWVGTDDGLFRLEGDQFRRFGRAEGLPSGGIHQDGLGLGVPKGLWVDTDRGLVFWDGHRFQRPSALGQPGLDTCPGKALPNGGAILSDAPTGRRLLSLGGEPFQVVEGLPWGKGMETAALSRDRATLAVMLVGGQLWVRKGGAWRHRDLAPMLREAVTALLPDSRGRLWIRTARSLFRLDHMDAPAQRIATPAPLSVVNGSSLVEDPHGRVWTQTATGLLWFHDSGSGVAGEREGLPKGGAMALAVDGNGTLWAGGDGVHKLLGDGAWTVQTTAQGLPAELVWSVHRARDGRLWAGTADGLAVTEGRTWRTLPGSRQAQYMALAEDDQGALWAGTIAQSAGQTCLVKVEHDRLRAADIRNLPKGASVVSLLWQPGQGLWIGTYGLYRLPLGAREALPVAVPGWEKEHSVTALARDGQGGLWVGGSAGLAHWDGQSWAVLPRSALEDGIMGLASTGPGEAFFCYRGTPGIEAVRREGKVLVRTPRSAMPPALGNLSALSLLKDGTGALWVGTPQGLLRWDGVRLERYGRRAGFPGEDCAQNALWVDPDGDVWVGLSTGLAHGQAALRRGPQLVPPVRLLEAKDGRGATLLGRPHVDIPWHARTLDFRYAPTGSPWTEGLSYQVRLVGLEDAWRDTRQDEARYPGLGPGSYRFEVRSVLAVTGETGPVTSLALRILPPWWLRPWFLVLAPLALAGLVLLGVRLRTAHLRRSNARLEALVHARTADLEKANLALQEASLVDPLTGLRNRRYLMATMPEEQNRIRRVFRSYLDRGENPLGRDEDMVLLMVDLDHFKHVNDTYGHAAGDRVLQQVGLVLRCASRDSDTLVRWGGEEFLLVAKRTVRGQAETIARHLCQAMRQHVFYLDDLSEIACTCSVGFVAFPILEEAPELFSWEDALEVADQCLYAAKHAGRDGYVGVHTPGPRDPQALGERLLSDLRGLLREGKIALYSSYEEPFGD